LALSLFTFFFAFFGNIYADDSVVSDKKISEISQRLEAYTTDSLIERRNFLVSYQEGDPLEDEDGIPAGTSSERALEVSVIDALLVALGAIILDNVTEDSSTPPDTVFPVITILGDNPAIVELGSSYTDAGATSDGGETVSTSGTVNTDVVGTYTITYSASDAAGNTTTATRTVNVVDTTAPVVTLTGATSVSVELGGTYTELGATATDASGAVSVVVSGTVDTDTVGSYTVTYSSTDASGNTGSATRTVNVVDTTAPVVTVTGNAEINVELTGLAAGNTYVDAGATATDLSGTVSVVTTGSADSSTLGTYTITYTATDSSGNV
jgi:Cu/Ag efflux protein CusF